MISNEIISCPFCGRGYPFSTEVKLTEKATFHNVGNANRYYFNLDSCVQDFDLSDSPNIYEITITKCPHCNEEYLTISHGYIDECLDEKIFMRLHDISLKTVIRPKSVHKIFPDYVPKDVRENYYEACSVLELSPRSAAALLRCALEKMIPDFWQISSKGDLKEKISELKGKIPVKQWELIDGLINLGNIGTHMENNSNEIVDTDPGEAEKLLMLVEHLIEQWYVSRHNEEKLYENIVGADKAKKKIGM